MISLSGRPFPPACRENRATVPFSIDFAFASTVLLPFNERGSVIRRVTTSGACKKSRAAGFRMLGNVLRNALERGRRLGLICKDTRSDRVAGQLIDIYLGSLVRWVLDDGREPLGRVLRRSLDGYLSCLR